MLENASPKKRDYKEYRATRKLLGRPVKSGSKPLSDVRKRLRNAGTPRIDKTKGWGEFLAWDGEGISDGVQRPGMTRTQYDEAVRDRAHRMFEEKEAYEQPIYNALGGGRRLICDLVLSGGSYRLAGEFADVPVSRRKRPLIPANRPFRVFGNSDIVLDRVGDDNFRLEELTKFLSDHPRQTTYADCLRLAREELEELRAKPRPHRYVMLANSDGDCLEGHSLSTRDCFEFLLNVAQKIPESARVRHVWFGSGYDTTMILRDLPREITLAILKNETQLPRHVWYDRGEWRLDRRRSDPHTGTCYAIHYTNRKCFRLARFVPGKKFVRNAKGRNVPNYDAHITLWDTFGFFQGSFVQSLKTFDVKIAIDKMAAMKERRSTFADSDTNDMRAYCIEECKALRILIHTLFGHFWAAGLRPKRLDGAGAVASAALLKENVKEHIAPEPDHLRVPIATAFFGGRIELLRLGQISSLYAYDLSSAYPAALITLPSLVGTWSKGEPGDVEIIRVRYCFPEGLRLYPLPYRDPRGSICFSASGEGWYWGPEVACAQRFAAVHGGSVQRLESWGFNPVSVARPFAFIGKYFDRRRTWQREGNGAEKALKLALNSLYGKTAQQLGGHRASPGIPEKFPPYFSFVWAGLTTAITRARLMDAVMNDLDAVVMFATDGIFTTRPLAIEIVNGDAKYLGGWESKTYEAGVFAQAGVYWTYDGKKWLARCRGFDRAAMALPTIATQAWEAGAPTVPVTMTRFVTLGGAAVSEDAWEWRGTWRTAPNTFDVSGRSPKRRATQTLRAAATSSVPLVPRANDWYLCTQKGYGIFAYDGDLSRPYDSISIPFRSIDGVPEELFETEVEDGLL